MNLWWKEHAKVPQRQASGAMLRLCLCCASFVSSANYTRQLTPQTLLKCRIPASLPPRCGRAALIYESGTLVLNTITFWLIPSVIATSTVYVASATGPAIQNSTTGQFELLLARGGEYSMLLTALLTSWASNLSAFLIRWTINLSVLLASYSITNICGSCLATALDNHENGFGLSACHRGKSL